MNPGSDAKSARRGLRRAGFVGLGVVALAIAGCTNARLVNVWQDPGYQGHRLRSVMIVSRESDPATRRLWEDAVRAQLMKNGIAATSSYEVFPDESPTKSDLHNALEDRGLDAALIFKPLAPTSDTHWVPGWTSVQPRAFYDPWGRREVVVYRDRFHPGYHYTERYLRQQVTVWSSGNDSKMVWAGTVLVPATRADEAARDVASGVVPAMKRAGMV